MRIEFKKKKTHESENEESRLKMQNSVRVRYWLAAAHVSVGEPQGSKAMLCLQVEVVLERSLAE